MHTEGFAGARDVIAQRADKARELSESLLSRGVRMVALSQVDNAGVPRVKSVPASLLERAVRYGIGMSPVFEVAGGAARVGLGPGGQANAGR